MIQLDDWVLCRVRQKSSIPRNIWEDRNDPSNEPDSYSLTADKACNMTTNSTIEMIKSNLFNDCPLLPYIFASQDFSAISYEGRNNGKSYSVSCENNSDQKNLQVSVSSVNSLFNPLKRNPIEGKQYESFLPPSKKLNNNRNDKDKFLLSAEIIELNCCTTEESEDNTTTFAADQCDSISQY